MAVAVIGRGGAGGGGELGELGEGGVKFMQWGKARLGGRAGGGILMQMPCILTLSTNSYFSKSLQRFLLLPGGAQPPPPPYFFYNRIPIDYSIALATCNDSLSTSAK